MKILGVSGSLQTGSSNRQVLRTVAEMLGTVPLHHFESTGDLPAFNSDLDDDPPPEPVARWRKALADADAVVISTPEYAHSYPGALKNALDWVVGSGEFVDKPVLVITAGPSGGVRARDALVPVLRAISANVVDAISIAAVKQKYDGDDLVDTETRAQIADALAALRAAVEARPN